MFSNNLHHPFPFSSPIKNLPIELLSYIFSLSVNLSTHPCLEEEEEEHTPPTITTESVQVPLVLSIVCRLWRELALNTPRLWSSLCITVELVNLCNERQLLDTSHITSYLALSRKYPLNILIDARDENWNFEPESVSDHGEELYTPAFTSEHMNTVFTLLLPHLSRWKSLSILTDCWAPMYTALTAINPLITRFGAPLLESLSLMRCNDLISFSPIFQPQQLKEPEFLTRGGQNLECPSNMMIPSLKYLLLRGVHVNWGSLGDILSTSETGLTCLVLGSHSDEVRPSRNQLFKILSSSIGLRKLVLSASGPSTSSAVQNDRASLPHLRNLTIGYRTAMEGLVALELINAPCTEELVLEDATHVADLNDINAAPLLSYFGTGQFVGTHQNGLPFPLLKRLTLTRVKTCSQSFRAFFSSLSNLQHLELKRMSMEAIHALLRDENCYTNRNCPLACPKLRSLCIRNFEQLDVDFITGSFDRQTKRGPLEEVDIYVNDAIISDGHAMGLEEEGVPCFDEYYASVEEIQCN